MESTRSDSLINLKSGKPSSDNDEESDKAWKNIKIINTFQPPKTRYKLSTVIHSTYTRQYYEDITCRIGMRLFRFHRAILLLNSNYFLQRKIYSKKDIVAEIKNLLEGDPYRFNRIHKIMYEEDIKRILKKHNFSILFTDMHNLGMEIDLKIFKEFIDKTIASKPGSNFKCRLLHLYKLIISSDHEYDYLLPTIVSYLSKNLCGIYRRKIFLSLSAKAFVLILLNRNLHWTAKSSIFRICATWICYDFKNRIEYLKDLVNIAKCRLKRFPYWDQDVNFKKYVRQKYDESNKPRYTKRELEKYFSNLLFHTTRDKFDPPPRLRIKSELCYKISKTGVQLVRAIDHSAIWMSFLEQGLFCDVSIDVRGIIFKLHRVRLRPESLFLRKLFRMPSLSRIRSHVMGLTKSGSGIAQYSLHKLDPGVFRKIVHYIYSEDIQINSLTEFIHLNESAKYLKMKDFRKKSHSLWLEKIENNPALYDIFNVYKCAKDYGKTMRLYECVRAQLFSSWPKFQENPHFKNISLEILERIFLTDILAMNNADEILDLSSKWICHDIEDRYHFIIDIALIINRNNTIRRDQLKLETPSNLTDHSQEYVKEKLTEMLSLTSIVQLNISYVPNEECKPRFLLLNKDKFLSVTDVNFNEIVQLAQIGNAKYTYDSTMIGDLVFVLSHIKGKFNFQAYSLTTKKTFTLGVDVRMSAKGHYRIMNCDNELYFYNEDICIKYVAKMNHWISSSSDIVEKCVKYTFDGNKIYEISDGYLIEVNNQPSSKNKKNVSPGEIFQRLSQKSGPISNLMTKMNLYLSDSGNRWTLYSFKWITQTGISDSYTTYGKFARHGRDIKAIQGVNEMHLVPIDNYLKQLR